jgi:hypothetical protein
MLHVRLSLLCRKNIIVVLGINEPLQAVFLGEAVRDTFAMLLYTRARSAVAPTYSVPFGLLVMMYTHPPTCGTCSRQRASAIKAWVAGTSPATG